MKQIKHRLQCFTKFVHTVKISGSVLGLLLLMHYTAYAQPQAASSPQVLISADENQYTNAVWSPDGTMVAFSEAGNTGIWLCDADGSNMRQLTDDPGAGFGFSWSPNSDFILARPAIFENRRRFSQVKIYDVHTAAQEIIQERTRGMRSLPVWTPDGGQIAMVLDNQLTLATSQKLRKQATEKPAHVVYFKDGALFNTSLITRTDAKIGAFEGRTIFNISVSPDGKKVAFQVSGKGLYVADIDGTHIQHIGHGERASWMPGSDFVVVSVLEDDGYVITSGELFAVDIRSGAYHHLTAHTNLVAMKPGVSPCGKKVVFDDPSNGNIYIMELK